MKSYYCLLIFAAASLRAPLHAQPSPSPVARPSRADQLATNTAHGYASDLVVVSEAQQQALAQARQMLAQGENAGDHGALETAIQEMEHAQAALESAKTKPDKLPAAIAAEQAAYQALLKATPREIRMSRSSERPIARAAPQASRTSGRPNSST